MISSDTPPKTIEILHDTWPQIFRPMKMDREKPPEPKFTKEELIFLQELLNQERSDCFNYYEDLKINGQDHEAEIIHKQYEMIKTLRNKVYHMTGRDTLAKGTHEQRWWDQPHDYNQ